VVARADAARQLSLARAFNSSRARKEKTMMIRNSLTCTRAGGVLAAGAVALALLASVPVTTSAGEAKTGRTAEDIAKAKPSGTFEVQAEQVRLLIGGGSGKGVLNYQGKQYPFTVKGVSLGGVGVTKVDATGTVYFLDKLEDFAGTYSAVSAGATVGAGAAASQFENNKGVFLSVKSKTEGVGLSLGLSGVTIAFAK
jgi:hypothetical protein